MLTSATHRIRNWLVRVFAATINKTSRAADRAAAIRWLEESRAVLARPDLSTPQRCRELASLINSRSAAKAITNSVGESVRNYRRADLPLSVKVAIPATLAAVPLVGIQGAGVAAFGSAIGMPVLLLVFLGASGLTAIIEAVIKEPSAHDAVMDVVETILKAEQARRASAEFRAAMADAPVTPKRAQQPADSPLTEWLLAMDPFDFERHIMSFFEDAGFTTIVTPRSNDFGLDGIASGDDRLMVIQCKRYGSENRVGRPTIQQLKGVVEENGATHGYIVTTSSFTAEAIASAAQSPKIRLVARPALLDWHTHRPDFRA